MAEKVFVPGCEVTTTEDEDGRLRFLKIFDPERDFTSIFDAKNPEHKKRIQEIVKANNRGLKKLYG